jgi:hypothetical protein
MKLKALYDSLDEVDEKFHELYTERGGKFHFVGVEGIKTEADIKALQTSLAKEREQVKALKAKAEVIGDLDPDDARERLEKYEELQALAEGGGKIDEGKLNTLVEARLKSKITPLERQISKLAEEKAAAEKAVSEYAIKERTRAIHDTVRKAATKAKVVDTAVEDALVLAERLFDIDESGHVVTRDQVGVSPGLSADEWLAEAQKTRPHWWGPSVGGGARGGTAAGVGGGSNPWAKGAWNMTEQAKLVSNDPKRADALAKAAGSFVGAVAPPA